MINSHTTTTGVFEWDSVHLFVNSMLLCFPVSKHYSSFLLEWLLSASHVGSLNIWESISSLLLKDSFAGWSILSWSFGLTCIWFAFNIVFHPSSLSRPGRFLRNALMVLHSHVQNRPLFLLLWSYSLKFCFICLGLSVWMFYFKSVLQHCVLNL